jgi:hypothetical protein
MNILKHLPAAKIIAAYEDSPGNEISSGKFESAESSAALAANVFGYFLDPLNRAAEFPVTGPFAFLQSPISDVRLEQEMRFPWRGGRHPWLDAVLENETWLAGIESKRFEPFRAKKPGSFAAIYRTHDWGSGMAPFAALCEDLSLNRRRFARLDAAQLVKHAFGLQNQAARRSKRAALVYVYAEPLSFPVSGRSIPLSDIQVHREEVAAFAELVQGADVSFVAASYCTLLTQFRNAPADGLKSHAAVLDATFLKDQAR